MYLAQNVFQASLTLQTYILILHYRLQHSKIQAFVNEANFIIRVS